MSTEALTIVAAFSAAAAAAFAGLQILLSVGGRRLAATFEHLRNIDDRLQNVWQLDVVAVSAELETAYGKGAHALSKSAAQYMALLNSLELLALAMENGAVDAPTANDFLRTLCQSGTLRLGAAIRAIRTGSKNERIYRCLGNKLREFAPPSEVTLT
jgi:hypothetical protein